MNYSDDLNESTAVNYLEETIESGITNHSQYHNEIRR